MSEFESPITTETDTLKEDVKLALNESDRERKEAIIENLDSDWAISLRGHLENARKEAAERGTSLTEGQERGILAGEVFESLIRADRGLFDQETAAAAELREVLHQPERFSLALERELGHLRTPDLAQVSDKGQIVGYAEAKLGQLDDRAFRQLSQEGSLASLRVATRFLREHYSNLSGWGLTELSERRQREIKVAAECERILVVPADRDLSDPLNLIKNEARTPGFEALLRDEITIVKSPFSLAEVWAIADMILEKG